MLRDVVKLGTKARHALEKHGLLAAAMKEIHDEIAAELRKHYAAEVASAEADLVRLQRQLEQGELRLAKAREEKQAYLIASGAPKPEGS